MGKNGAVLLDPQLDAAEAVLAPVRTVSTGGGRLWRRSAAADVKKALALVGRAVGPSDLGSPPSMRCSLLPSAAVAANAGS